MSYRERNIDVPYQQKCSSNLWVANNVPHLASDMKRLCHRACLSSLRKVNVRKFWEAVD